MIVANSKTMGILSLIRTLSWRKKHDFHAEDDQPVQNKIVSPRKYCLGKKYSSILNNHTLFLKVR